MSPEALTIVVTVGGSILGIVLALAAYIFVRAVGALEKKTDALESENKSLKEALSKTTERVSVLESQRVANEKHIDTRFNEVLSAISDLKTELRERPSRVDPLEHSPHLPPGRGSGR